MEEANRVTAYLKVTAEFYDPEATPETVRACVEQDLEDAGYEVEVESHKCGDERDYKQDYLDFVNLVTFSHFKKEGFQEPPSYPVAKAAFLGCLPEWRKKEKWISVKDRLPESSGVATLVTAVNTHGQKCVFEAFLGYGDMHWYTLDTTKMQKHGSNRVDSCWTITHWTEMPEPAEDEA
jgi:hypothetical protein